MQSIVVFGAGGHAKTVIDVIEKQGLYRIIGLLDSNRSAHDVVYDYNILGDESWLSLHSDAIDGAIVAIGDNWTRSCIVSKLKAFVPTLSFITAIHPSAELARGSRVGVGSVVMAGAVINSDATVDEHCILYPHTSIDHDSRVGSFVSFAPQSVTGGNVSINDYTAIAIGATIAHGITIGEHSVIGAGATVLTNIPSHTIAYGTPARVIRPRGIGERYL
ncbi:acetyltransferase [Paenibacillus sp. GSMTC-2017]|nr:acetyltransferase [Paenibacillus sp. GSMTC-2017]